MRSSLKLSSVTKIGKDELKKITIIITSLFQSNDSFDFREPVDWKGMGLTDYPIIIKYPIDLSTVNKKIKEEKYTKVEQILDDIQLIWDNCKTYNPDNSWIHSIAQKLQRSFRKMVKNYFPDLNTTIPIKPMELSKQKGPYSFFDDDNQDITYHQKLKFSQQLSFLTSDQLSLILDQIVQKCPKAYKDLGDGKGQVLVDNMDLVFFNEISITVKGMINGQDKMDEQIELQAKPIRGRGAPPKNKVK